MCVGGVGDVCAQLQTSNTHMMICVFQTNGAAGKNLCEDLVLPRTTCFHLPGRLPWQHHPWRWDSTMLSFAISFNHSYCGAFHRHQSFVLRFMRAHEMKNVEEIIKLPTSDHYQRQKCQVLNAPQLYCAVQSGRDC